MTKYFDIDERWQIFGIKSKEEYLSKYLIKGYFHASVPVDIREAFVTVEYLLAHAWHHYPLYDEGLNKALRIMEMAIRLRAKELGLEVKAKNGSEKKLHFLIGEICNGDHLVQLKKALERLKRLRNMHMHPQQHGYMGIAANLPRNVKLMVNLLNRLFQNDRWHQQIFLKRKQVQDMLNACSDTPLILAKGEPLIGSIIDFEVHENSVCLMAEPIRLNIDEVVSKNVDVYPIGVRLNEFSILSNGFSGISDAGAQISISVSDKPENLVTFHTFKSELAKALKAGQGFYKLLIQTNAGWGLVDWEYEVNMKENQLAVNELAYKL